MRRMRIVEQAILPPGECALTRDGQGPFVDTLREGANGWRLYASTRVVEEMAALLGWLPPASVDSMASEIATLRKENAELLKAREQLRELRLAIRTTLVQGAVIDRREPGGGDATEFSLRSRRGEPKVEV